MSSSSSSNPDRSPPGSRQQSSHNPRRSLHHIPAQPSRLREAQNVSISPEDRSTPLPSDSDTHHFGPTIAEPSDPEPSEPLLGRDTADGHVNAIIAEPSDLEENERTRLLEAYNNPRFDNLRHYDHGTFHSREPSIISNMTGPLADGYGSHYADTIENNGQSRDLAHRIFGDTFVDSVLANKSRSPSAWLASAHGIHVKRWMYLSYYFPFLKWITQYRLSWFRGDLIAALTMASFYIPMSLSYAANLGHIPPVNGLYAFVFNPIIYALLGTCPQMVVGPEAAGSLLVGQVVRTCIEHGHSDDDDDVLNAQIAGVVTSIAGAVIFAAGLTRLGFLDSVLSRPFLRGFISAIGFVILIDQAIPELGLDNHGISHESSVNKLIYVLKNIQHSHALTAAVSWGSFVVIMIFRTLKRYLQPRYPSVAYFPDRFLVVVLSAVLAAKLNWEERGLELLGNVKTGSNAGIPFHWPLKTQHITHIDTALGTSVLIALLGFFESSVAAKSLGDGSSGLRGMTVSANRELIALGAANLVGGCFMALPAFGGYGRSKVNASTGGTTPMSSILLSIISLLCVVFLLPYFRWLPKGVLSAMISVVAYSLIEEAPHDIRFFIRIRGWMELSLMAVIFLSTMFYSLSVGIALGIALSLLAVVRHAAKPRIQILGRVPGARERFENAEHSADQIEHIEGCLIVKIPEPLTFANTGDLRTRLRRLEQYGTNQAHPSLPRVRHEDNNRNVIFDVHGVTSIDGSGAQVLAEIVKAYVDRGIRVIFCRLSHKRNQVWDRFERSGIIELCGGQEHFVSSIDEALKLSEVEDLSRYFEERSTSHEQTAHN